MNLDDLAKLSEFNVETAAYGAVHCSSVTESDIDAALCAVADGMTPAEAIRNLFVSMATEGERRKAKRNGEVAGREFSGAALSDDEVERIAEKFYNRHRLYAQVDKNSYLQMERDESHAALFLRVLAHYREKSKKALEAAMAPLRSAIFGSASRAAWSDSVNANGRLRASIHDHTIEVAPPLIFSNPTHETNGLMTSLLERVDAARPVLFNAAELMANLDTTVRNMHADFARNAIESDRKARFAEWIAIASVVLTLMGLAISTAFSAYQASDSSVADELKALRLEQARTRELLDRVLAKREKLSYPDVQAKGSAKLGARASPIEGKY